MAESSTSTRARKDPASTRETLRRFPSHAHPSGRWCKKIRGKLHYFGKIAEPDAALERFNREWSFLKDGRTPPPIDTGDGCTVRLLCNSFLTSKRAKVDSGELCPVIPGLLQHVCDSHRPAWRDRRIDDLRPDDFHALCKSLAKTRGLVTLKNEINRCRVCSSMPPTSG